MQYPAGAEDDESEESVNVDGDIDDSEKSVDVKWWHR